MHKWHTENSASCVGTEGSEGAHRQVGGQFCGRVGFLLMNKRDGQLRVRRDAVEAGA